MRTVTAEEVVATNWSWGIDRYSQSDVVELATGLVIARTLRRIAAALDIIQADLRSVGHDGLHDLIRLQTRRVRRKENARVKAQRARAARRKS